MRHAVEDLESFKVYVTDNVEPDDVLESLHQGSEARPPLMLTAIRSVVAD